MRGKGVGYVRSWGGPSSSVRTQRTKGRDEAEISNCTSIIAALYSTLISFCTSVMSLCRAPCAPGGGAVTGGGGSPWGRSWASPPSSRASSHSSTVSRPDHPAACRGEPDDASQPRFITDRRSGAAADCLCHCNVACTVPSSSVKQLWEAYTLLSDGWGLNEAAFLTVVKRSGLASVLGLDNSQVPGAIVSPYTMACDGCMAANAVEQNSVPPYWCCPLPV